jgi:hypothetical protein
LELEPAGIAQPRDRRRQECHRKGFLDVGQLGL